MLTLAGPEESSPSATAECAGEDDLERATRVPAAGLLFGLNGLELVAVVVGFGLCVAFGSVFLVPTWTPRMVFVVAVAPLGFALMIRQAIHRDRIAIAGVALVVWGLIASGLGADPVGSFVGRVGMEESGLVLMASLGLMALGRELGARGRAAVMWTAILGVAMSSLVGVLQYLNQTESGAFAMVAGRSSGLTSNPVYFGACAAGAFGVIVAKSSTSRRVQVADVLLALLFGAAISLSASRVALGAAVLVGVVSCVRHRNQRVLAVSGGFVAGVAAGTLLTYTVGNGLNSIDRLGDGGASRTTVWRYGFDALLERPVQGWGFGEFRPAVQSRVTVDHARSLGVGMENALFDAHNALVEIAVALGIVGLAITGVLVALICRQARGPLAVGVSGLALSWMLQPMGLATFPLALLLIGCALPAVRQRQRAVLGTAPATTVPLAPSVPAVPTRGGGRVMWLVVPGLIGGLGLGAIDVIAHNRYFAGDTAGLAEIVDAAPDDAVLADIVAQSYEFSVRFGDEQAGREALVWRTRAVESQPNRTRWWVRLARLEGALGNLDAALVAVDRALALEPNSLTAVDLKMTLLKFSGDTDERRALMPYACALGVPSCDESVDATERDPDAVAGEPDSVS